MTKTPGKRVASLVDARLGDTRRIVPTRLKRNEIAPVYSPVSKEIRDRRRALGIYYTPPVAARLLAKWAIRKSQDTILEPSFGGCSMLSAAVEVFESMGNHRPSKNLYGFDIDAQAFGYLTNLGIENSQNHFQKRDFLRSEPGEFLVDAVLANPPFVSYHRSDKAQREIADVIRKKYLPGLHKRASLWAHFLLHSLSFLRPGGRMAFVLPNAIANADYAQPLLEFLCSRFSEVDLLNVAERLFIQEGTDERISLLLLNGFNPGGLSSPTELKTRHIGNIQEILTIEHRPRLSTDTETGDYRKVAEEALALLTGNALCQLGSVAHVQIGEVVGDIRFFVRPLVEWQQLEISSDYLVPILTRSAQVPGIWVPKAKDCKQTPSIPYLLLPPEGKLPKSIQRYLSAYSPKAVSVNRTFSKRQDWYRCSYRNEADAFICSMNHDIPRIIGNDASISCSNAFYKITLHKRYDLAAWLPILSLTTPMRLSAEYLGRVRGSGGIKLEPSDVKRLCIPTQLPAITKSAFKEARTRLANMLQNGELDAASQFADSLIFLQPGLIDSTTMARLRRLRLNLTTHRFIKPQGKIA